MRTHGNLTKWNDDRGYGFILPANGTEEVFVHVSAFPRDGKRPLLGELVAFDITADKDGRKRALRVTRPGSRQRPPRREAPRRPQHASRRGARLRDAAVAIVLFGAVATIAYTRWHARTIADAAPPAPALLAAPADEPAFACGGRTMCSQMHSCAEATWVLQHCPDTKMDGNGDGVPCERQWCDGASP